MPAKANREAPVILTIGHSTHPIAEFVDMLKAHEVSLLVDVRTVPRSRTNPQFNLDALPASLAAASIDYRHMPGLGGLRKPKPDSQNSGWRNSSFRGYADYMQSAEFRENLEILIELSQNDRVAIMCAEAVPWRCHRSLIGDALLARKIPVEDIMSRTNRKPHKLTPFARVKGTSVTYPASAVEPAPAAASPQRSLRSRHS